MFIVLHRRKVFFPILILIFVSVSFSSTFFANPFIKRTFGILFPNPYEQFNDFDLKYLSGENGLYILMEYALAPHNITQSMSVCVYR